MSMHIRFKRQHETIFLWVSPFDSFVQIKERLGAIYNLEPHRIAFLGSDKKKEIVDMATVSDQEVENDDVIHMIFTRDAGGWEECTAQELKPMPEVMAELMPEVEEESEIQNV